MSIYIPCNVTLMLLDVEQANFLVIITFSFYTCSSVAENRSERAKLTSFSRFLLASLHMQALKDKVSMRKVKEALAQLPRGSGSAASKIAYDETMNRIRGQEKGFCDLAIATLSWISLAKTPLILEELQCALSVEPGDTAMDEANFVDQETLSSVCAGLVVVDHESRIVRLAHYTTQEYFESQKDIVFLNKENLLAETCLTYLSFDVFSNWRYEDRNSGWRHSQPPSSPAAFETNGSRSYFPCYPLLDYAARYWHEHAHRSQGPTVQKLLIKFLKRTENLAALLCLRGSYHDRWFLEELFATQIIHGLLIAARYGFTDAFKALLHLEGYCPKDRSRIKEQALRLAVAAHQSSAVRILLDVNTITSAAASHDLYPMYNTDTAAPPSHEVAEILIKHGTDPNTTLDGSPWIHFASRRNDVRYADVLLSHGADVELRDTKGRTALHCAAEAGQSGDIVKLLLEYKLDINARDDRGETALSTAVKGSSPWALKDHTSLITQLLGCGASVDQSDIDGWTALHWAASNGIVQAACPLLEANADVNARTTDGDTAADCLTSWHWGLMRDDTRAECEGILKKHNLYRIDEQSPAS